MKQIHKYFNDIFKLIATLIIIILYMYYKIYDNIIFVSVEQYLDATNSVSDTNIIESTSIPVYLHPRNLQDPEYNARYLSWISYNMHNNSISFNDFTTIWNSNDSFKTVIGSFIDPITLLIFKQNHYVEGLGWYTIQDIMYLNTQGYTIQDSRLVRLNR